MQELRPVTFEPDDPALLRIHAERLIKRDIDQLLGICEFALQDGVIDQPEAESVLAWLDSHRGCLDRWPANVLYDRLRTMLSDGALDDDEQGDLLGLVLRIAQPRSEEGHLVPTALPFDEPAPPVVFDGRSFCFTGVFDFGLRADCQAATSARGGTCFHGVTKKLHYLVIGNVGSECWRHSSFGTKIAKAMEYRERGVPIAVVSETQWASHLE